MTLPGPILVVDVGGTNAKAKVDDGEKIKVPTGPDAQPGRIIAALRELIPDDSYAAVTIGIPSPVLDGAIQRDPTNLGPGWAGFDYAAAFDKPVRLINDAALQAIGGYEGGTMLFLGFGTGLGSALIKDGKVIPLELAHLPYLDGGSYEDSVGDAGHDRLGHDEWERRVHEVTRLLREGTVADEVLIGGGNVKVMTQLPDKSRRGGNRHAFAGGLRLWRDDRFDQQFPPQQPGA